MSRNHVQAIGERSVDCTSAPSAGCNDQLAAMRLAFVIRCGDDHLGKQIDLHAGKKGCQIAGIPKVSKAA
jgi:hypothetical protein